MRTILGKLAGGLMVAAAALALTTAPAFAQGTMDQGAKPAAETTKKSTTTTHKKSTTTHKKSTTHHPKKTSKTTAPATKPAETPAQ